MPLLTIASYVATPALPLFGKPPSAGVLIQFAFTPQLPEPCSVETTSAGLAVSTKKDNTLTAAKKNVSLRNSRIASPILRWTKLLCRRGSQFDEPADRIDRTRQG